jgi:hypothetical protein
MIYLVVTNAILHKIKYGKEIEITRERITVSGFGRK